MCFTIKCISVIGIFPEPQHDPVIQIANVLVCQGTSEPVVKNVFTLGECAPIVGTHVLCHKTEVSLLEVSYNCIFICCIPVPKLYLFEILIFLILFTSNIKSSCRTLSLFFSLFSTINFIKY
jgi:hypothetical protein